MAFTYAIEGKILMAPSQKGMTTPSGRIDKIWGVWDGTAVTTGDLFTRENFSQVLNVSFSNETGATAIQNVCDSPSAGQSRMTFTSGHAGRFEALVLTLGK